MVGLKIAKDAKASNSFGPDSKPKKEKEVGPRQNQEVAAVSAV